MTDERLQTISPLLIVVRVGLAQARTRPSGQTINTFPLEINVLRTENTFSEFTSHGTGKPQGGSL